MTACLDDRKEKFHMFRKVYKDAFPTILSYTMSGLYSVVDGIFIGKATGDTGLAAINIAWPVPAVITALGIGIGTGGSVLYSNYKGRGDVNSCQKILDNTMTCLMIMGILIMILFAFTETSVLTVLGAKGSVFEQAEGYTKVITAGAIFQVAGTGILPILRNLGFAVEAMLCMITGFFTNIGVNYLLMFEYGMGIRGAAVGTVIAQMLVLVISVIVLRKKTKIHIYLEKGIIFETIRIGITAFGISLAPTITLIFTNIQCLRYGGDAAVACYAVISYIVFPVQYLLTGIGDGVQPLMSYYNGAGRKKEVQQIKKIAYLSAMILGICATIGAIATSTYLAKGFGLSEKAESYFGRGMQISACAFVLIGVARFNLSSLNATMHTREATGLTYIESMVISPILLFLLPMWLGIKGLWLSLPATAVVMNLLFLLFEMKTVESKKIREEGNL